MKSLYVQIVLTFLGAIVISLLVTFLISGRIHAIQVADRIHDRMEKVGKEFVQLYKGTDDLDVDSYLDAMSSLSYDVLLYKTGEEQAVYEHPGSSWELSATEVQKVLDGGVVRNYHLPPRSVLGLPFEKGGEQFAFFIKPDFKFFFEDFRKVIIILFSTVLVLGSAIFLITTRWTIKPIKELTQLTQTVGKGNFNVSVSSKRNDELGDLTKSFNQMVHGLGELEQMRHQFVSNVSHEIQSPLTSIQGFAKAIKDDVITDDEERKEYLAIIEHESRRLSSLSQNLLKLASLDSDHPPFHPETYQMDEQLRRVVAALEPQWNAKGLNMNLDLESVVYYGDQDQMEQVWINLLTNAIRYSPADGTVSIVTHFVGDEVTVSIIDSGEGIPEEEQGRIFERFYKVDKARSRNAGGNGLGLSIAKKIVLLHRGYITVESQQGKGAVFRVTLPL
ncbi:sensor histidine kinase [Pontibacillus salicampi]|uniref:Heme sensor protein HssS n=1 Tax=Pontibacillus salicampi TaxID=1449801 RepID=A0ABV6LPN2_9BACI